MDVEACPPSEDYLDFVASMKKSWESAEKLLIDKLGEEGFQETLQRAGEVLTYYHDNPANIDDETEEVQEAIDTWIRTGDPVPSEGARSLYASGSDS